MADKKSTKKEDNAAKKKLDNLEEKLSKQSSSLPQLSKPVRKNLDNALPWVSGAFGLLALVWAKDFWDGVRALSSLDDSLGIYGSLISSQVGSETEFWIVLLGYLAVAVLIGLSFAKGLVRRTKEAWKFLFYGYGASVITGLLFLFLLSQYNSSRAFLTLIVGLGGLYVLFQLREDYK